jgi:predicted phosphoribosyltransferase
MPFIDRVDAGKKLAAALAKYRKAKDAVVVALPRGGVVLGRVIADDLGLPLDIIVPRKIGAPENEEYAIGAVTESGHVVWNAAERARIDDAWAEAEVSKQKAEAARRLKVFRAGLPPRDLKGKTVLLVDDGIATGYTIRAAIETARAESPSRLVVAVPVSPPDSAEAVARMSDEFIALERPDLFLAIGAFYNDFVQVEDDEVAALMRRGARRI